MTNSYDVAIVGGRVAGAATALLLARAGVRVAVVERGVHGSDALSTHALMRAGVLQLSRWGVLDDVVAAGTPAIREAAFHYAGAEPVRVAIRDTPGVPALYAPRRFLLDRILVDAAAEAGAQVRHQTAMTGLLRDWNGRVTGIGIRDRAGQRSTLRATVTVGADGVNSALARRVDAPLLRRGTWGGAFLYRYSRAVPALGYEWAYGSGAAAGLLPTNDGLTGVFVGTGRVRSRELVRREGAAGAFRLLLAKAAPQLAERVAAGVDAGRIRGWAGLPGHVRQSWGPGWALVGDAGYYTDPITTHGITSALRDAQLLAREVLAVLGGAAPESVALARYQATRDQLSSRLFDATERVARYDWDAHQIPVLLRQVSTAMSDELDHLGAIPPADHSALAASSR
jgi:flavin-dependent dehydrogenase